MLESQLLSAADASTTQTSAGYAKGDLQNFAVQFNFSSATLNGTASIDCSNDNVNWTQVSGSALTVTSGATAVINVINANYKFLRAIYTASSGTGTVTALLTVVQPTNRF